MSDKLRGWGLGVWIAGPGLACNGGATTSLTRHCSCSDHRSVCLAGQPTDTGRCPKEVHMLAVVLRTCLRV